MKQCISYLCILLLAVILFSACSQAPKQLTGEEIFVKISPSTVEVSAESEYISSLGTGFYIDTEGTVVTNYHVIEGCSSASVTTSDGGSYEVTYVLGYSKELDVAILATSRKNSDPIEFVSDPVVTGETVYALGSSLGLTGTFSEGVVSSAERKVGDITYIQITAPISHGNSGGPLVNKKGQVVGITSAGFSDGQNLNLALPISILNQIPRDEPLSMEEFYDIFTEYVPTFSTSIGVRTITVGDKFTAEFILAMWQRGETTEDSMIKIMDEYGTEQGGGQLYVIEPGDFVEEVNEWCFDPSRQVGDVAIIENAYGFTICYISSLE